MNWDHCKYIKNRKVCYLLTLNFVSEVPMAIQIICPQENAVFNINSSVKLLAFEQK